jgi:threonyl-tRNA synthetase
MITVYRCGDFFDLCSGPHIPNTSLVRYCIHSLCLSFRMIALDRLLRSFAVVGNSPAHWADESDRGLPPSLQRVYGISFPEPKQLQEWFSYRYSLSFDFCHDFDL